MNENGADPSGSRFALNWPTIITIIPMVIPAMWAGFHVANAAFTSEQRTEQLQLETSTLDRRVSATEQKQEHQSEDLRHIRERVDKIYDAMIADNKQDKEN